jgi:hypothetical protein
VTRHLIPALVALLVSLPSGAEAKTTYYECPHAAGGLWVLKLEEPWFGKSKFTLIDVEYPRGRTLSSKNAPITFPFLEVTEEFIIFSDNEGAWKYRSKPTGLQGVAEALYEGFVMSELYKINRINLSFGRGLARAGNSPLSYGRCKIIKK